MSREAVQKKIRFWEPQFGEAEKQLVSEVLDSGFVNDGEMTERFEKEIARICDVPYAVAVTSGTAALFLALKALDIGSGDEVIVPDITFIATANAVSLAGAKPVLADVDPKTLAIHPGEIEKRMSNRTKAVIPVHVSGRCADMSEILKLAKTHHLKVIEDAAEALGSKKNGKALGTFGDMGCFSFSPNKTITTGQGGMVVTRDSKLEQRLRELKDQGRSVRGTGGADEHVSLGFNFKLTNLQAAIGLAQLKEFSRRLNHLRELARVYQGELKDIPGIGVPGFDLETGEVPQWVDILVESRDRLHDFLLSKNAETRKFWHPLHTQAPYREDAKKFPVSSKIGNEGLWLPSAFSVTAEEAKTVCRWIREWAAKTNGRG